MKGEDYHYELSQSRRYRLKAINRMALGSILILWGGLLALKQAGIVSKDTSTWPFVFVAFGTLLVIGGIYRIYAGKTTAGEMTARLRLDKKREV